jgi:hypothetical protein
MITKNEISYGILFLLILLEDFQLAFFSWKPDLFSADSQFNIIQYIFNPLYWISKNATPVAYVVSFGLLLLMAVLISYCTFGLVRGRLKASWPLLILRILCILTATVLFTPILEALAQPLTCTDGYITGFKDSVKCGDGIAYALYAASIIGALFYLSYGSIMAWMFFEPSVRLKLFT